MTAAKVLAGAVGPTMGEAPLPMSRPMRCGPEARDVPGRPGYRGMTAEGTTAVWIGHAASCLAKAGRNQRDGESSADPKQAFPSRYQARPVVPCAVQVSRCEPLRLNQRPMATASLNGSGRGPASAWEQARSGSHSLCRLEVSQ